MHATIMHDLLFSGISKSKVRLKSIKINHNVIKLSQYCTSFSSITSESCHLRKAARPINNNNNR